VDARHKAGHDGDEHLRIFTVVSSIFGRVEGTTAAFHIKLFHAKGPKELDFRDLENRTNKFADRA
jgi:hypothetical protein